MQDNIEPVRVGKATVDETLVGFDATIETEHGKEKISATMDEKLGEDGLLRATIVNRTDEDGNPLQLAFPPGEQLRHGMRLIPDSKTGKTAAALGTLLTAGAAVGGLVIWRRRNK